MSLKGSLYYGIALVHKRYSEELKKMLEQLETQTIYSPKTGFDYKMNEDVITYFFGVDLNYEVNQMEDVSNLASMLMDRQKTEYEKLFNALSSTLQEELKKYGHPKVFFVWSD